MSQDARPERTYEVGRGKPPKHSQFKSGQSGNPNGRHKKQAPAIGSIICGAFAERVIVTVNGKPTTLTKKELVVEQQIAKILKGDMKALRRLLKLRDYVDAAGEFEPLVVRITEEESMCVGNPDLVPGANPTSNEAPHD
jgi:hypothetical protein